MRCKSGQKIITQGELGDSWYVVESGKLETWKSYEGEEGEKMVKGYGVGDSFGEVCVLPAP